MPVPTVWSERNELNSTTGLHDCAYASILMCLVYGGKVSYPLGLYTAEEREALERSDSRPNEEGASSVDIDLAVKTRYGLTLRTTTDVRQLISSPGKAVSVGGRLSNFSAGHRLRRFAPLYTGGHRICVIPRTEAGTVRWLDPLAPWGFAGDVATVLEVMTFAMGRLPSDARYVDKDEFAATTGTGSGDVEIDMPGFQFQLADPPRAGTVTFAKGVKAYSCLDHHEYVVSQGASRDGVTAISGGGTAGYIVDLSEGSATPQAYFIYAADATFKLAGAPTATTLAPGLYEVPA